MLLDEHRRARPVIVHQDGSTGLSVHLFPEHGHRLPLQLGMPPLYFQGA